MNFEPNFAPILVAKLTDTPDLGIQNYSFQNVAFRSKKSAFYEGKKRFSALTDAFTNDE
jgi:hypothetical protein